MGRVESIHAKGRSGEGGLYKPSIPEGQIGQAGLEGDFNHFRAARLKGDPDQALLLMPWETLEDTLFPYTTLFRSRKSVV